MPMNCDAVRVYTIEWGSWVENYLTLARPYLQVSTHVKNWISESGGVKPSALLSPDLITLMRWSPPSSEFNSQKGTPRFWPPLGRLLLVATSRVWIVERVPCFHAEH